MLARELPDAREMVDIPSRIITYGYSPKYKDLVCAIAPYKKYINLIFAKSTLMSDPGKILAGTRKRTRHIKIQELNDVEKPGVAEQVRVVEPAHPQPVIYSPLTLWLFSPACLALLNPGCACGCAG